MGNMALASRILSDNGELYTPSFSGGSWEASLPLTNLKDRRVSLVARSTNDDAASTQFDVDLGAARDVGIVALVGHNISAGATWRVTGGTSSGGSQVYDSGALNMTFSSITAEDRAGFNPSIVLVPSSVQTARYWRVAITDTSNVDGYVQIGRALICERYVPTINMSLGVHLGFDDPTIRTRTDASSFVFDAKPVCRTARFVLDHAPVAEGQGTQWIMKRRLGTSGQTFFVFDVADTTYMHERAFLCTMRQLSPIDFPFADGRIASAYELVEEI